MIHTYWITKCYLTINTKDEPKSIKCWNIQRSGMLSACISKHFLKQCIDISNFCKLLFNPHYETYTISGEKALQHYIASVVFYGLDGILRRDFLLLGVLHIDAFYCRTKQNHFSFVTPRYIKPFLFCPSYILFGKPYSLTNISFA